VWSNVEFSLAANVLDADYCIDPDENILIVTGAASSTVVNLMEHYITCNGTNPFQDDIVSLQSAIDRVWQFSFIY